MQAHLHSLPDHPDWIPHRTSYWGNTWGFCLSHADRDRLIDGEYEVCIDATLADGSLSYGECVLPGESEREVLVSCHICHPALANDNLSGIAVATWLAAAIAALPRRYTYRFLLGPGMLGAISWLAANEACLGRVAHGLVIANVGDSGGFHYKRSRRGDAGIDRVVPLALAELGEEIVVEGFVPFGCVEAVEDFRTTIQQAASPPIGS